MILSKLKLGLALAVIMIGVGTGRALAQVATCHLHQAECTYDVLGCYANSDRCPGSQFGYYCYTEYGTCCGEGGTGYSRFCSTGCDGTGGGTGC